MKNWLKNGLPFWENESPSIRFAELILKDGNANVSDKWKLKWVGGGHDFGDQRLNRWRKERCI